MLGDIGVALRRPRRRGSFMVLVVGTLAMLSIIMIVYVSIGNADKRTSRSIARRDRSDEIIATFSDYAAQIIADDAVTMVPDSSNTKSDGTPSGLPSGDLFVREAWDAPTTKWVADSTFASTLTTPTGLLKCFRPVGLGDDPWLASTTPTWINYKPAQTIAVFPPDGSQKTWAKRRDWLHITNIAPDGRFVNLFNLRDNYDARPGTFSTNTPGDRRLNGWLSLTDQAGTIKNQTVWGQAISPDNPAFFDSWQEGAFRPARGPFGTLTPKDAAYPPYQWADADGDGWFDSRWFELTDARGQNGSQPSTYRSLLPSDPNYRWFFAARIIDLSSLVNVNAAGDMNADPNDTNGASKALPHKADVVGIAPSDVDLRRLLMLRDADEMIFDGAPAASASITISDVLANGTQTTRVYRGGYGALRQPASGLYKSQDYSKYVNDISTSGLGPIAGFPAVINPSRELGQGAYRALRGGLGAGAPPGHFSDFTKDPLKTTGVNFPTIRDRANFYTSQAATMERAVYDSVNKRFDFSNGFRTENLIELLTFRGINDPRTTSSLECAMGGWFDSQQNVPPLGIKETVASAQNNFSPLRENRALELERENLSFWTGGNAGDPTEAALLRSFIDVRQYLTTHSGARPIVPAINPSITTIANFDNPPSLANSGELSTYIAPDPAASSLFKGYATALAPGLGIADVWKPATGASADANARSLRGLFYGHQGPLTALLAAGHMAANFATSAQPPSDGTTTAQHVPYTLVLDENRYTKLGASSLPQDLVAGATTWKQYFPSWWKGPDYQFNLARNLKADGTRDTSTPAKISTDSSGAEVPVPAVNVYGAGDVHPFLVETATYTCYRDTWNQSNPPDAALSDGEGDAPLSGNLPPLVTINGKIDAKNADFLMRVLAVKIQNPYTVPIQLSSEILSNGGPFTIGSGGQFQPNLLNEFFYLQIGTSDPADPAKTAKYYVLAEVDETIATNAYDNKYTVKQVTILPGETIVFYAMNRESKFIVENRFNVTDRIGSNQQQDPSLLEAWLTTQIGPKSAANFRRIEMMRVDNVNFGNSAAPIAADATFKLDPLVPDATLTDHTVMLRRAVRADSGPTANDSLANSANSVVNDELCDRLRNDNFVNLDRQIRGITPTQQYWNKITVTGMFVNPNSTTPRYDDQNDITPGFRYKGTDYPNNYNTRFTITLAAHIARKGEAAGVTLKPGMLPAWAIDPKDVDPKNWYDYEEVPAPISATSPRDVVALTLAGVDAGTSSPRYSSYKPGVWRLLPAVFPSMAKPAESSGVAAIAANSAGKAFAEIRRELAANRNKYEGYVDNGGTFAPDGTSQLRPTDLLNIMAVGSVHTPIDFSGNPLKQISNPAKDDLMRQWTTTSEAFAIALGYANPPADQNVWKSSAVYGPLDYYYFDLNAIAAGKPQTPIFDSGYLKTDDFVSCRFDSNDKPYTAGTGAPIAGNVLTMFRTRSDSYGSLTNPTPGLININTAPQAVLRLLPFTFPSKDEVSGKTFWPGTDDANREAEAKKTDIAAMIESYRDKIAVELRPGAKSQQPTLQTWYAGFFDRSKPGIIAAGDQDKDPNDLAIGDYTQAAGSYVGGRYLSTGIFGLREGAGFHSVGELLAVRQVAFDPTTRAVTAGADLPCNIDFFGARAVGQPTNLLGTDNIVEQILDTTDPAKPKVTDIKPLQFGHTYQDKLKILSGLLGSISVRSDMYAVWFIARGYQRSDCEGLPDLQPMVPSVERRFLMIIDRSNVTKVGQKPRVVAFVEVPL